MKKYFIWFDLRSMYVLFTVCVLSFISVNWLRQTNTGIFPKLWCIIHDLLRFMPFLDWYELFLRTFSIYTDTKLFTSFQFPYHLKFPFWITIFSHFVIGSLDGDPSNRVQLHKIELLSHIVRRRGINFCTFKFFIASVYLWR